MEGEGSRSIAAFRRMVMKRASGRNVLKEFWKILNRFQCLNEEVH